MRTIITSAVTLLTTALLAQITIGPADMPTAGDTVRYVNTDASAVDLNGTEAGFLWDMGMLVPDVEGADTCVAVSSTPLLYQFYFNNPFLYPEWQANHAQRGRSFDFQGQLTVNDVYDYFKKDDTGYRNVGFGANINGVPASVRRIPVDWIHRFPMNYGDMDTSYSEFSLDLPTLGSFTQQQTRYNEVDGWGTLYLPADTFDVLRVKSTLVRIDSVFIAQFGQGFTFPEPETIEYKWIALGMDMPVLLITTTGGQTTTARFYYDVDDITTNVGEVVQEGDFSVFPSPASGTANFRVPAEGGIITLRDAAGRVVHSQRVGANTTLATADLSGVAAGNYIATFISTERIAAVRLVVGGR